MVQQSRSIPAHPRRQPVHPHRRIHNIRHQSHDPQPNVWRQLPLPEQRRSTNMHQGLHTHMRQQETRRNVPESIQVHRSQVQHHRTRPVHEADRVATHLKSRPTPSTRTTRREWVSTRVNYVCSIINDTYTKYKYKKWGLWVLNNQLIQRGKRSRNEHIKKIHLINKPT